MRERENNHSHSPHPFLHSSSLDSHIRSQYQFAEGQARQDFPGGRVHQGVYGVYTLFAKEVLTEVARLQPAHVFVTGHSLGGALAHLLSYTIADRFPGMTVDSVTFASIMMADESMMAAMAEKINMRNIFYLGPGQDGLMYRVGDLIPQATWYVLGVLKGVFGECFRREKEKKVELKVMIACKK